MSHLSEQLLGRFRCDGIPALEPAKVVMIRMFEVPDDIRKQADKLAQNPHLTAQGQLAALQTYVAKEKAADLYRARKTADTMEAKLSERRARLVPSQPDKSDLAAVILRSEMRGMVRAMKPGERMAFLLKGDADSNVLSAVLEGPNVMSGIDDSARALIADTLIERAHPGQLATIELARSAVEEFKAAAQVTFDSVCRLVGFSAGAPHLSKFVSDAIGDTRHLDADVERIFAPLANVA